MSKARDRAQTMTEEEAGQAKKQRLQSLTLDGSAAIVAGLVLGLAMSDLRHMARSVDTSIFEEGGACHGALGRWQLYSVTIYFVVCACALTIVLSIFVGALGAWIFNQQGMRNSEMLLEFDVWWRDTALVRTFSRSCFFLLMPLYIIGGIINPTRYCLDNKWRWGNIDVIQMSLTVTIMLAVPAWMVWKLGKIKAEVHAMFKPEDEGSDAGAGHRIVQLTSKSAAVVAVAAVAGGEDNKQVDMEMEM